MKLFIQHLNFYVFDKASTDAVFVLIDNTPYISDYIYLCFAEKAKCNTSVKQLG